MLMGEKFKAINIRKINLDNWRKLHPRAYKHYPDFFVDFNPSGSKKKCLYSWTACRNLVLERDGYKCRICGSDKGLEVHHILPRKLGGTDHPENLITLCRKCHLYTFRHNHIRLPKIIPAEQTTLF